MESKLKKLNLTDREIELALGAICFIRDWQYDEQVPDSIVQQWNTIIEKLHGEALPLDWGSKELFFRAEDNIEDDGSMNGTMRN